MCAPAVAPIDALAPTPPANPQDRSGWMRSIVHVLKWDGSASPPSPRLKRISSVPVGNPYETAHDLHGYGACGLAVADLDQTGQANPTPEILVTTLNGEFVVFGWDPTQGQNGQIVAAPKFTAILDGQLGAFNSIVVGDFDPQLGDPGAKPEVYIASSLGIRKFYVP